MSVKLIRLNALNSITFNPSEQVHANFIPQTVRLPKACFRCDFSEGYLILSEREVIVAQIRILLKRINNVDILPPVCYIVKHMRFDPLHSPDVLHPSTHQSPRTAVGGRVFQSILRPLMGLISLGCRARVTTLLHPDDLTTTARYVIAANHQSAIDTFVIGFHMQPWSRKALGHLRCFAHSTFFLNPVLRYPLSLVGGIPTRPLPGRAGGLAEARCCFDAGNTVMIFPEGTRSLPGATPAKRGIGEMARWPNARIIPVRLQWYRTRFGRRYSLTIGRPFDGSNMSSQEILDAIYDLPLPR